MFGTKYCDILIGTLVIPAKQVSKTKPAKQVSLM